MLTNASPMRRSSTSLRCVALPQQSGAVPPRIITPPRQSHATPEPCSALLCLRLALRCNAAAVPSVPVRLQRYVSPCLALSVQRTAFPQRGFALQCLRNANLIQSVPELYFSMPKRSDTMLIKAKALQCIPYAMQIIPAAVLRLAISLLL